MTDQLMDAAGRPLEQALSGWPYTGRTRDGSGVRITGKYMQPTLEGNALMAAMWGGFLFVAAGWAVAFKFDSNLVFFGTALGWPLATACLYSWGKRRFRREFEIEIYPDRIELYGRRYARLEVREFRLERHHKALEEQHREMNTGQRTSTLYRQAIEVVMQYGERRIVIAEMREKDQEMARALVVRLQDWCERFDQMLLKMADGPSAAAPQPAAAGEFGPPPPIR